ncbi:MAG TPA: putative LPS assembly protein LptD [Ignavibacteriales bacterium]|nr:putative LPS assembly protein LptD [Ignavibacteriales bacterium]
MGNVFELKTLKDPTDTTSQAKKITLLNLSANTSYNFARDSLKLSDLSVSYNTNIANIFSFNGNSTYSFYVQKRDAKRGVYNIDQFMASQGRGLFRLTNLNFSFGTTRSGEKLKGKEKEAAQSEEADDGLYDLQGTEYQSIYDEEQPDFSIPWDLTLNYSYNMNRRDPQKITQTSSMTLSFNMNLTPSWKFSASGGYDLFYPEHYCRLLNK